MNLKKWNSTKGIRWNGVRLQNGRWPTVLNSLEGSPTLLFPETQRLDGRFVGGTSWLPGLQGNLLNRGNTIIAGKGENINY